MIQKYRTSEKGFTLIELMIVVAIIGILAAIAIPNFIRFQLKSKSSEGKVNLAAIRTAEEGYRAEYGTYVAATASPAADATALGATKMTFTQVGAAGTGFDQLGWSPEGKVYFQYEVVVDANSVGFAAAAQADIDADNANQGWAYVKTGNITAPNLGGCAAGGAWDATLGTPAATLRDTVAPCDGSSGQSVF